MDRETLKTCLLHRRKAILKEHEYSPELVEEVRKRYGPLYGWDPTVERVDPAPPQTFGPLFVVRV